ncbi:MAG: SDR family oxidoreductase [Hyphomicrobiales bacterium]|nr:SDR family oxidoreductase [Hyphomicrobiales bacterium]MCP4999240.1 SDR family oxidoreductase [Hyphomicrobiales bacterium]
MRLFVFGAGYSGRAIAAGLANDTEWSGGTSRSESNFPALDAAGLQPFIFDSASLSQETKNALRSVTHLVQSIAPEEDGDPILNIAGNDLRALMPKLQWACYLSTVGVYGDHQGAWVGEETECHPVSKRSLWRSQAEMQWLDASKQGAIPGAVLRLSGIYGPGRNPFLNVEAGTARRIIKPGQVFNRIHVHDIVGATEHLIANAAGGIWNVTDDLPAPPQDVVEYACTLMGVAPPPEIAFETADLSPMARSFYGETKRVSNAKLKNSGYTFRAPDYKSALATMWREDTWRA